MQSRATVGSRGTNFKAEESSDDDNPFGKPEAPKTPEEEGPEKPRSASLPKMAFNDETSKYEYELDRDFRGELNTYMKVKQMHLKKQNQPVQP